MKKVYIIFGMVYLNHDYIPYVSMDKRKAYNVLTKLHKELVKNGDLDEDCCNIKDVKRLLRQGLNDDNSDEFFDALCGENTYTLIEKELNRLEEY